MNKKLIVGAAIGFAAVGAMAAAAKKKAEEQPRQTMWQKMEAAMEEMPEDFPPRVMFDNVEETRANTEKILEILEQTPQEDLVEPTPDLVVP